MNIGHLRKTTKANKMNDPKGPPFGTHRVVRGGNWFGLERYCRVILRHFRHLDHPRSELGFRLVLVRKE